MKSGTRTRPGQSRRGAVVTVRTDPTLSPAAEAREVERDRKQAKLVRWAEIMLMTESLAKGIEAARNDQIIDEDAYDEAMSSMMEVRDALVGGLVVTDFGRAAG
jgi:hypothetical protein